MVNYKIVAQYKPKGMVPLFLIKDLEGNYFIHRGCIKIPYYKNFIQANLDFDQHVLSINKEVRRKK